MNDKYWCLFHKKEKTKKNLSSYCWTRSQKANSYSLEYRKGNLAPLRNMKFG